MVHRFVASGGDEPMNQSPRPLRMDDLRRRSLLAWLVLAPTAAVVFVMAISMRPSRAASCDAALPCEIDEVPVARDGES